MSYDLNLFGRPGVPDLDRATFMAHFVGDRYQIDDDEVHYSNPDTGVYFHFTFREGGHVAEDNPNRRTRSTIYFNMNYFRPHTFGLEADLILKPLVKQFDLIVSDPQSAGMGEGEYDSEGFLRGWNAGNAFAAQAFRQLGGHENALTIPTALNRKLWGWNFDRKGTGEDLWDLDEIDVYVPPIWFCKEDGKPRTFALYPNLVPTAVPKVDYVLLLRNELSSPFKRKSKETPAWVRWQDLRDVAADFELRYEDEDHDDLDYLVLHSETYRNKETAPRELAKWVIALPDWPGKPDQVNPDQILDAELLAGPLSDDGDRP